MQLFSQSHKSLFTKMLVVSIILALAGATGYFYYQYQLVQEQNPVHELASITKEMSKTLELPDEEPNLATVTDKSLLADQPFFANAENGDKVLIYRQWGKAILYRPSTKKIIDITNVTADVNAELTSNEAEVTPPQKVHQIYLLNGSSQAGATRAIDAEISDIPNTAISGRDSAAQDTYTQTLVIAISEDSAATAQQIATALGAKLSTLPEGETAPDDADIVVIVGGPAEEETAAEPEPTVEPSPEP